MERKRESEIERKIEGEGERKIHYQGSFNEVVLFKTIHPS